jgi:hypothetical protein
MENTPPAQPNGPDYSKVGGWLLAFGILAGLHFLSGTFSILTGAGKRAQIYASLASPDAQIYGATTFISLLLPFVALAQCVCIFRRLRVGRTLSLIVYGASIVSGFLMLPFLGSLLEAASAGANPAVAQAMTFGAVIGMLIGLTLNGLSFAYFLRSERVKQTLVN